MERNNEVSTSVDAIRHKVNRLIEAHLKGEKSTTQVQEAIDRWWSRTHPLDRPAVKNTLNLVLAGSFTTLAAIRQELALLTSKKGNSRVPTFPIPKDPVSKAPAQEQ